MPYSLDSYSGSFLIASTDTDASYACRPSALLAYLQEVITEHAGFVGVSRDDMLAKYNCYWMVLRIQVKLERPVIWGETLRIELTVRRPAGTRLYRDCELFVGQEKVGEASTEWVLANHSTRRPVNLENFPELPKENPPGARDTVLHRVRFPENMELHDRRKLYYSDTDINGHISNTRYVDLACDAAELNRRPHGVFLQEFLIAYVGECYAGETLEIYRGKENGKLFLHGVGPRGDDRFDCVLRMSSEEGM